MTAPASTAPRSQACAVPGQRLSSCQSRLLRASCASCFCRHEVNERHGARGKERRTLAPQSDDRRWRYGRRTAPDSSPVQARTTSISSLGSSNVRGPTYIPRHGSAQRDTRFRALALCRGGFVPDPEHRRTDDLVLRLPASLVYFECMDRVPCAVVARLRRLGCCASGRMSVEGTLSRD